MEINVQKRKTMIIANKKTHHIIARLNNTGRSKKLQLFRHEYSRKWENG